MLYLFNTVIYLTVLFSLTANSTWADEVTSKKPSRKRVKLPGMVVDFEKQCVDLEATICLDKGFLELIACRKGSKEHESIVAVSSTAMHIHTAWLLLAAKNGNPAMRRQVGDEEKRWGDVPPRGDGVDVFLLTSNKDGTTTERPIGDFVVHSSERVDYLFIEAGGFSTRNPVGWQCPWYVLKK